VQTTQTEKIRIARREFVDRVEQLGGANGEYLAAIAQVCLENEIDETTAAEFVTGTLRALVTQEAKTKKLITDRKDDFVELPLD